MGTTSTSRSKSAFGKLSSNSSLKMLLFTVMALMSMRSISQQVFTHPAPQSLPYSENFNTSLSSGTTTTWPAGWGSGG